MKSLQARTDARLLNEKKQIDDRGIQEEILSSIEQIVIDKVDSKFMEFEAQHVNTVFKYGSAELLQDEFDAFQTKV